MNKKNKVIILASIIVGVLVVTLGLTYAVISFNETKGNSELVLGDIWMHYGESNQINLQNAIPTESYIPNGYFEFTIDGKNTYTKKDIWYEIVLNHGDEHATRSTRIRDDLLKFRLVEVNNNVETELFTNKSYSSLTNKRIWVDTISKNTTSEINKIYRLYMWISNDTKVGNTSDSDYDNETWNDDVYGSIKVSVTGDFQEKELAYEDKYNVTDASCFETEVVTIPKVNPLMEEQSIEDANELTACVLFYNRFEFDEGSTAESFCKGTGTLDGNTFQQTLALEGTPESFLSYKIVIIENDEYVVNPIMTTQTVEEVNELTSCVLHYDGIDFDEGSDAKSYCQGTGTSDNLTLNNYLEVERIISYDNPEKLFLENNNLIIKHTGLRITNYNTSCGTDVVIPKSINGQNIIEIYKYSFKAYDNDNKLTNVIIPNGVVAIGINAFADNNLTFVNIPSSVINLECGAFDEGVVLNLENENLACYTAGK